MKFDRDFVKKISEARGLEVDFEGGSDPEESGLIAKFHPDGNLSYFGYLVKGKPSGWRLEVEPGEKSVVCREQSYHFPEDALMDPDSGHAETFEEWVERWVVDICEDLEFPARCSFCGKGQDEVRILLTGRNDTYICDECVTIMANVINEQAGSTLPPGNNA
jgi:ClpX C4-type zinc finger